MVNCWQGAANAVYGFDFCHQLWVVGNPVQDLNIHDINVGGAAKQLTLQVLPKSRANRQRYNQRHDARRDSQNRDHRNHGDDGLFSLGFEISQGYVQLKLHNASLFFRSHMRKENDIANGTGIGKEHRQTINPDTFTGGRRHSVAQGPDVV